VAIAARFAPALAQKASIRDSFGQNLVAKSADVGAAQWQWSRKSGQRRGVFWQRRHVPASTERPIGPRELLLVT
jgi:hypothetical protein